MKNEWLHNGGGRTDLEIAYALNLFVGQLANDSEEAIERGEGDKEGRFVVFFMDSDGFVLNQDGEYLMPAEFRAGKTFVQFVEEFSDFTSAD
jgi:hypothetical protein